MSDLLKQPKHYSEPVDLNTRYGRSEQRWNDRIGTPAKQARSWRLFGLLLALILLCSVLVNGWFITQSQVKTVIVRVNKEGTPFSVEYAGNETYAPSINEIRYFLTKLVINTRSLPQDAVLINKQWTDAYHYLTEPAQHQMSEIALSSGIDKEIEKIRTNARDRISRAVDIKAFLPLSQSSYQVRWEEKTFSSKGILTDKQRWSANFTITVQEPTDEIEAFDNPLGLYVTDFSIARDIQ